MNVEFINPFLSSMSNVLTTMAQLSPKASGPKIKNSDMPPGDITGIVPMSSPKAIGTLAISFTEQVILHIAENMLGEPFAEINSEIADLVGELTNMVTGGAKSLLESEGYDFDMATPTVITGKGQKISHIKEAKGIIVIPFNTDAGDFFVEVCFQNKS